LLEFKGVVPAVNYLKDRIQLYWSKTITEEQLITDVTEFLSCQKNRDYIFRGNDFAPSVKRMGQGRLVTFKEVLSKIDNGKYSVL